MVASWRRCLGKAPAACDTERTLPDTAKMRLNGADVTRVWLRFLSNLLDGESGHAIVCG